MFQCQCQGCTFTAETMAEFSSHFFRVHHERMSSYAGERVSRRIRGGFVLTTYYGCDRKPRFIRITPVVRRSASPSTEQ